MTLFGPQIQFQRGRLHIVW